MFSISTGRTLKVSPFTTASLLNVDRSHRLKLWMSDPYGAVDLSNSSIRPNAEAHRKSKDITLQLTLRRRAERPREVARLTIDPLRVLEHTEEEARLAQEAVLLGTFHANVRLGHSAERRGVVQRLQERIGVRVEDIRLETAVLGTIVEPYPVSGVSSRVSTHPKSKSSIPNLEYLISTLR